MNQNERRRLETSLKMTSNVGIIVFATSGIVIYLAVFLGIVLTRTEQAAFWKILIGALGGALVVGASIVIVLRFVRFFLVKRKENQE